MALSAVVLPAPLGPMRPRMRPSSTRRSTPSRAMVVPKALRRPRASMQVMASTILLRGRAASQQFFRIQAEALNRGENPRPFFREKLLPLVREQLVAGAGFDEHAQASLLLDELLVDQLLVGLQDRDRVDPIVGRDGAHGRQRIAFLEHAVEDQRDDEVPKLPVDRLAVVPFAVHQALPEYASVISCAGGRRAR